jgi:hypothetical protein
MFCLFSQSNVSWSEIALLLFVVTCYYCCYSSAIPDPDARARVVVGFLLYIIQVLILLQNSAGKVWCYYINTRYCVFSIIVYF